MSQLNYINDSPLCLWYLVQTLVPIDGKHVNRVRGICDAVSKHRMLCGASALHKHTIRRYTLGNIGPFSILLVLLFLIEFPVKELIDKDKMRKK